MRRSFALLALVLVIVSFAPGCLPFSLGRYSYGRSRHGRQSSYGRRSGSRTATASDEYVQPRATRRAQVTYDRPLETSGPSYGYAYSQPTGYAYRPYGYSYDQSYVSTVLDSAPSSATVQSMVVPPAPAPGTVYTPSRDRVLVTPQSPASASHR